MKFAKELEDDLVPEWRAKYINYKQGKKKIKAISKALRNIQKPSRPNGRPLLSTHTSSASIPYTHYDFNSRSQRSPESGAIGNGTKDGPKGDNLRRQMAMARKMSQTMFTTSPPIATQDGAADQDDSSASDDAAAAAASGDSEEDEEGEEVDEERTPLQKTRTNEGEIPKGYGSFDEAQEPKKQKDKDGSALSRLTTLKLPDPALDPGVKRANNPTSPLLSQQRSRSEMPPAVTRLDGSEERPEAKRNASQPLLKDIFHRLKDNADKDKPPKPQKSSIKDIFKSRNINSPEIATRQQEAYTELDARQDDFFNFLDKELRKIEKFYKQKEEDAKERLEQLRAQLHEHRDQRARDIEQAKRGGGVIKRDDGHLGGVLGETPLPGVMTDWRKSSNGHIFQSITHHQAKIGQTSKKMEELASPPMSPTGGDPEASKDYTRKKEFNGNENVPHRFAKRRLKLAMQEFYRGLELLKSYALLNRTGFRKINKKYDKAVNARPPLRYLNEKVSEAHFVKSTNIDEYLVSVEDLYARYFERGNRKVAVNKLRSKLRLGDHSASTFRNGLMLAAGACFGIAGLADGVQLLFNHDPTISSTTSYLLQLYAGYFLALLLFLLFVLDCKIWNQSRINYVFVFEYDTRHVLDWRQLAEIPCFFLLLNGLILYLNFKLGPAHQMYRYWPIILFGITLLVIFLPFRILYSHSRKWFAYSNFRLLLAGLFPVEFRDFFLGDMYCSETYFMSQVEIFFCLYVRNWNNPAQCNSGHSMLLGFLTTLPAIWRFMQCLRRYYDSRNWFPHLANCVKYLGNIIYYMSLSLYRLNIHNDNMYQYRITFIVFAAINGLYCSFWDIFMDWSLGNPFSKHRFLRNHLAYRRKWVYYVSMVVNTILRHQWIFYALFTHDLQHSAAMSFFVGLAEVLRRGLWTLFRVENEHTNNVKQFRASRDIPLPYSITQSPAQKAKSDSMRKRRTANKASDSDEDDNRITRQSTGRTTGTDYDVERQTTQQTSSSTSTEGKSDTPGLRALRRVGTVIAAAHAQDFQKKRRPEVVGDSPSDETLINDRGDDSSDDDGGDYGHEIEGSVKGNDDDDGDIPEQEHDHMRRRNQYGGKQKTKKKQDKDKGKESASGSSGSGSEGDDGKARTSGTRGDEVDDDSDEDDGGDDGDAADRANNGDIEEARRLVQGFHPQSGLRGGIRKEVKEDD